MKPVLFKKEDEKIQWELKRNNIARKTHLLPPSLTETRGAPEGAECDSTANFSSNSFNNDRSRATIHNYSSFSASRKSFHEPSMTQIPNAELSGFLLHYLQRKNNLISLQEKNKALLESARKRWNLQPILPFVFANQNYYRILTKNKSNSSCTINSTEDFTDYPINPFIGKPKEVYLVRKNNHIRFTTFVIFFLFVFLC